MPGLTDELVLVSELDTPYASQTCASQDFSALM